MITGFAVGLAAAILTAASGLGSSSLTEPQLDNTSRGVFQQIRKADNKTALVLPAEARPVDLFR